MQHTQHQQSTGNKPSPDFSIALLGSNRTAHGNKRQRLVLPLFFKKLKQAPLSSLATMKYAALTVFFDESKLKYTLTLENNPIIIKIHEFIL